MNRRSAVALLLGAVACSSTDPTPPVPPPEPTGWIYFGSAPEPGRTFQRVNVATGIVEPVPFSEALPAGQTFLSLPGMVSPVDGRISAQGYVQHQSWPQTFVYDPKSGDIEVRGDPAATRDFGHVWSPDGRFVVFERHLAASADGRSRLVRLDVTTGISDTIVITDRTEYFERLMWLGNDSLVINYFEQRDGSEYRVLDIASGMVTPFAEVENEGFQGLQAISASGEWIANWTYQPPPPDPQPDSLVLSVRRRRPGELPRRSLVLNRYAESGTIDVVFSPDEHFFADCPADDTLQIVRIPELVEVKRLPVPLCSALSWSLE